MKLSRYEQETNINFNQEDKTATVYTCNYKLKKQLDKLSLERPEQVSLVRSDEYGTEYIIPKTWVKIRANRILSDEQRKVLSDRMSKIR